MCGNGWSFGGSFDVLPRGDWTGYLYSLGLERSFLPLQQVRPFVGIGIGGMTVDAAAVSGFDRSRLDLLVPLAAGIRWQTGAPGARWGIRAEVRDDIVFRDEPCNCAELLSGGGAAFDARARGVDHNLELSAGVSFLIGPFLTDRRREPMSPLRHSVRRTLAFLPGP